jgi:hypothetical protein
VAAEADSAPRTAEELLERLRLLGLTGIMRCRLTQNRAVMVSFGRGLLRLHRGYLGAPRDVHEAIVLFVSTRVRGERRDAQRVILGYPVGPGGRRPVRRLERPRAGDDVLVSELVDSHRHYNRCFFRGMLDTIPIRISSRMRSRLGQYSASLASGEPGEIAISRRHIHVHDWGEVLHTLLHEMVHQWQAEHGYAIDHGRAFRAKAREVGIAPTARRDVVPVGRPGHAARSVDVVRQAARRQ